MRSSLSCLSKSSSSSFNASTFAARVAASTGADLYACVVAGLATLSGPRHGGAGARVEALLARHPDAALAFYPLSVRRIEDVLSADMISTLERDPV